MGSVPCFLTAITSTEIKCRLRATNEAEEQAGKLIVFLKTSEEAVCTGANDCEYRFTGTVPEVTSMDAVWDETNKYWTVEVTGTGMTGTPATTELNVNGRKQETISVTATKTVFKITDIDGFVLKNMNVYFDVGLPKGYDTVVKGKTLTLSPKLVSVNPNYGSVGGALIVA